MGMEKYKVRFNFKERGKLFKAGTFIEVTDKPGASMAMLLRNRLRDGTLRKLDDKDAQKAEKKRTIKVIEKDNQIREETIKDKIKKKAKKVKSKIKKKDKK